MQKQRIHSILSGLNIWHDIYLFSYLLSQSKTRGVSIGGNQAKLYKNQKIITFVNLNEQNNLMGKKREALKVEPLVNCIVDAILDKKGKEVTSLEIGKLPNSVCDFFIICHADSTTQVHAIAENIELKVRETLDEKVWKSAGYDNSIWVVLDFVNVVVHIFQTEWRDFYKMEDLWADAPVKKYSDEPQIPLKKTQTRSKKINL